MRNIVIVGAGGFGREIYGLITRVNKINKEYNVKGFYDDDENLPKTIQGLNLLGSIDDLSQSREELGVVLALGVPAHKKKVIDKLKDAKNLSYPNIFDPTSITDGVNLKYGKGNIICAGTILTCDIILDDFITLNLSCTLGHDTHIKSFSSFMPSVNISGGVVICEEVYVGTGAKIINQLEIGAKTIVGAGAVVSKSLPSHCTAVGIPAKPIKFHNE